MPLSQCRPAWRHTKINSQTRLAATVWRQEHDPPNDGADQINLHLRSRIFNWENLRFAGRLPLFSGSYLLLTIALGVATGIAWVNDSKFWSAVTYPIPMPPRLIALLVGSALLAVGSTVFELACPPRVKEYSRTQWIEELRRPGVLYISDGLQRPEWTIVASVFILVGGGMVAWVFAERLIEALIVSFYAIF